MSNGGHQRFESAKTYLFVGLVAAASLWLLISNLPEPYAPPPWPSKFWNALATFTIIGIVSDSLSFKIPVARVTTSVGFIPFIAAVALFPDPWPMVIAGVTALVVDGFIRHKPTVRVVFNIAQVMLATGLASLVYLRLGGFVSLDAFDFSLIPFACLVGTFFVVNKGSVALAVAVSSGVSIRESWGRIGRDALGTDLFSSTLALLLAFLYVKLQLVGIAVLVFPLFLVRQLYQMNVQLTEELEEKLELMVKSMEARDPYTSGHSRRVSEYGLAIARELALSAEDLDNIKRAALLHDVGQVYEEFAPLLRKEGKLTPEEMMTMRTHVVRSAQLVATAGKFRGAVEAMIRHHHENFDGTGYPDGLAGDQIPFGARIIMVADTIDAMTTDRPYRKAMGLARAVEELEKYAGRQFDPGLVKLVAKSSSIRRLLGVDGHIQEAGPGASRPARPAWAQRLAH